MLFDEMKTLFYISFTNHSWLCPPCDFKLVDSSNVSEAVATAFMSKQQTKEPQEGS
jgi:hypothetical protein